MTERERRREDPRLRHLGEVVSRHDERLRAVGGDVQEVKQTLKRLEEKLTVHVSREDADRGQLIGELRGLRTGVAAELKEIRQDYQKLNTDFEKRGAFAKGVVWLGGLGTTIVMTGLAIASKLKGD